jgi:PAS domain S-box-containing protein
LNNTPTRDLLEALPAAVALVDRAGRLLDVNQPFQTLMGRSRDELLSLPIDRFLKPLYQAPPPAAATDGPDLHPRVYAFPASGDPVPVRVRQAPWPAADALETPGGRVILVDSLTHDDVADDLARGLRATVETAARLGAQDDPTRWAEGVVHSLIRDFDADLAALWVVSPQSGQLILAGLSASWPLEPDHQHWLSTVDHPVWSDARVRDVAASHLSWIDCGESLPTSDFGPPGAAAPDFSALSARATMPLVRGHELLGVLVHLARKPLAHELEATLTAFTAVVTAALSDRQLYERARSARLEAEVQRQKLQTILDELPIGVMLLEGPEGRMTLLNPAAQAMGGTSSAVGSVVLGTAMERLQVMHLDGRPYQPSEQPLWRALFRHERTRETLKYRRDDGREVFVEVSAAPYPGPEGGAVAGFRDVTAEVQLRTDQAERAAELKALLDHLPVGVAYFDESGVCRAANGPARRILRRSRGSTIGAASADLFRQAPSLHSALTRCLQGQTPHFEHSTPWTDTSSDPQAGPRFLDWRFEPLNLVHGHTIGALALVTDVTDRKLAADQLRASVTLAEQASRDKTRFLAAVSHDLRTPVNALSLLADCLSVVAERQQEPDRELRPLVSDLKRSTSNLVDLVNDLLELTLLDSGDFSYKTTDFTLGGWLDEILIPLRRTARARGLDLVWSCDEPERRVHTDRVKLGRVLVNLAGNAIKFTESGSITVRAEVHAESGLFRLSVADTGPGIPEAQFERIFDEFAQLRNPQRDRTRGTGLGLPICRRLVEGAGGRIRVQSRLGVGSVFTAEFPCREGPAIPPSPLGSAHATTPVPDEPPDRPRTAPIAECAECLLLVEDDPFSRRSLARLLEREGFRVLEAEDGPGALDIIASQKPALVLLDLMLPGLDGADVLREIRNRFDRIALPVVVLSGDLLSDRAKGLHELDVNGLLAKPIEFGDLLEVVRNCLNPHDSVV